MHAPFAPRRLHTTWQAILVSGRWQNPPPPDKLSEVLENASQLWVISSPGQHLGDEHLALISDFFDDGVGLFLWGDNAPCYEDANFIADTLIGASMEGDSPGDQTIQAAVLRAGRHVG